MTTVSGPSEAWFLTAHDSYAALEKSDMSTEANPGLSGERDRLAGVDGELLARTSTIIARYRPALSYQATVKLPNMRYMTVDVVRVKSGRQAEFTDAWRMMVDAHTKANMDEHWAVYQVESGMPDTTYLFMYARKSLAELDASGPMHTAAGFRDAVSDSGRRQMSDVNQNCIEMTQTMHFRLRPGMSTLSKQWAETDSFWAASPAPVARLTPKKK
jgi:predicted 3-demethylubiquinone-9 3-methyltransferase (glyoxalase superfamily)